MLRLQAEHYGTRIIENQEKIVEEIMNFTRSSDELSVSFAPGRIRFDRTFSGRRERRRAFTYQSFSSDCRQGIIAHRRIEKRF